MLDYEPVVKPMPLTATDMILHAALALLCISDAQGFQAHLAGYEVQLSIVLAPLQQYSLRCIARGASQLLLLALYEVGKMLAFGDGPMHKDYARS